MAHRDHRDDAQAGRLNDRILSRRALNRALLARQLLLRRAELGVAPALEHLVGLQAQATLPPYIGLWSRLEAFDPDELGRMLTNGKAVRLTLMRGTVHLVTSRDAQVLRPLVQEVIERSHSGAFGRRMGAADPQQLSRAVAELLALESLGARELGRRLVAKGIGDDAEAIGNAARVYVPLVQLPPRGVWGASGRALYATLEAWTGRPLHKRPALDAVVRRYLGAFGPASVLDMQRWSGLTKLKEPFERLRPQLAVFHDEQGRELFDLPGAPRPDPGTPAPVRFLGEYDNVLLGHADRRRVIPDDFPWDAMLAPRRFVNNLLVRGMLRATWWLERDGKRRAVLAIRPFRKLSKRDHAAVTAEAWRLLDFAADEAAARDVRVEEAVG